MSARAAPPVFLISGRDPLLTSGGSESYAVAQARATMLAGYEPHVFSVARRSEELRTDFGVLHRVASPVRPPRSITCALQRPWLVPTIVETVEPRRVERARLDYPPQLWRVVGLGRSRCRAASPARGRRDPVGDHLHRAPA